MDILPCERSPTLPCGPRSAACRGLSEQSRRRNRPLRLGQHQHGRCGSQPAVPKPRPHPRQTRVVRARLDWRRLRCAGIYPGKYTYKDDLSAEQMALVAMENYDKEFRSKCLSGLPPSQPFPLLALLPSLDHLHPQVCRDRKSFHAQTCSFESASITHPRSDAWDNPRTNCAHFRATVGPHSVSTHVAIGDHKRAAHRTQGRPAPP
jgi:hypothetical protein